MNNISSNLSPRSSKEVPEQLEPSEPEKEVTEEEISKKASAELRTGMKCLMHKKPLPCEDCRLGG